jgi:hypothetical protein
VDVSAPGLDQLRDHLALDPDHVREEMLHAGVDVAGTVRVIGLDDRRRGDQRLLDDAPGQALCEAELIERAVAQQSNPLHYRCTDATAPGHRRPAVDGGLLLGDDRHAHRRGSSVSVTGNLGEALHEVTPPELAVGQHWKAVGLLLSDDLADRLVLNGAQLVLAERAVVGGGKRRHELRRTQQTSDRVHAYARHIDSGLPWYLGLHWSPRCGRSATLERRVVAHKYTFSRRRYRRRYEPARRLIVAVLCEVCATSICGFEGPSIVWERIGDWAGERGAPCARR